MKRFLCFSLCLGLMVSACKKKSLEESVNKAIAKAGAGGAGGGGDGGTTTVTKKDKATVLGECLPKINTKLIKLWSSSIARDAFFLRRSTVWDTTEADPLVVLYTGISFPLQFREKTTIGLGQTAEAVKTNLAAMAASKVIQNQFVARDGNAPGWRVHISLANTDVGIPASEWDAAPEAPKADSGIIIYDRENVVGQGVGTVPLNPREDARDANSVNFLGGWFDCVVDDKTQDVTLKYAAAPLT